MRVEKECANHTEPCETDTPSCDSPLAFSAGIHVMLFWGAVRRMGAARRLKSMQFQYMVFLSLTKRPHLRFTVDGITVSTIISIYYTKMKRRPVKRLNPSVTTQICRGRSSRCPQNTSSQREILKTDISLLGGSAAPGGPDRAL